MVFRRQIACGMQFAKCITHQGFVAVVVEPNMGPEAGTGFTYLPAGTGAELIKVANHLSRDTIAKRHPAVSRISASSAGSVHGCRPLAYLVRTGA